MKIKWFVCVGLFVSFNVGLYSQTLERKIQSEIYDFIESRVYSDSFEIFIEMPNNGTQFSTSMPNARLLIDWAKGNDALAGRVVIPVKIFNGSNYHSQVQVIATIKRYEYVCVTNQKFNRHHEINQSDVRFELRDVSNLFSNPIRNLKNCLGKRTKRVVSGNRMLTEDMIEFPPMIERGNMVKIILQHRNLEIVTTGIARQDGWKGDIIRVRQNSGNHIIQCVVKSGNLVLATM